MAGLGCTPGEEAKAHRRVTFWLGCIHAWPGARKTHQLEANEAQEMQEPRQANINFAKIRGVLHASHGCSVARPIICCILRATSLGGAQPTRAHSTSLPSIAILHASSCSCMVTQDSPPPVMQDEIVLHDGAERTPPPRCKISCIKVLKNSFMFV